MTSPQKLVVIDNVTDDPMPPTGLLAYPCNQAILQMAGWATGEKMEIQATETIGPPPGYCFYCDLWYDINEHLQFCSGCGAGLG